DDIYRAAFYVLSQNLVHGDALTMCASRKEPITFAEWGYLGKGKFQRRDFRLDRLTGMAAFREEGTLFAGLGRHEIFQPTPDRYPPMTVRELSSLGENETIQTGWAE
ncbi:MAG TPA: SAM-dependent DNA methyltransferase, partial [Sphingorhabdus lacus]|nr:SAM-dependent DNA methyltransferase [Sphingorhabdus lacus]